MLTVWIIIAIALCFAAMTATPWHDHYARDLPRDPDRLDSLPKWTNADRPSHNFLFPTDTTVLVIDDDEDICCITELLLRKYGLRVLSALDGDAGYKRFCEHADQIDVVLLDMTMPGMSGVDVSRLILERKPNARIIMSSGYSDQTASEQIEDHDHLAFLQKPYSIDTLLAKIGAAILPT